MNDCRPHALASRGKLTSAPPLHINLLLCAVSLALLLGSPKPAQAGGVGISVAGHPDSLSPEGGPYRPPRERSFRYYRVPAQLNLPLATRDLRFHWSDSTYVARGTPLVTDTTLHNDLSLLGTTLLYHIQNPFNFPYPDMQLVTDYFNQAGLLYDTNPQTSGFILSRLSPSTYATGDRNHIDVYVYYPQVGADPGDGLPWPNNTGNRGTFPSEFIYAGEDVAEGRAATISEATARHGNSLALAGPRWQQVGDSTWWVPDDGTNWVFAHEFQHALNTDNSVLPSLALAELRSSAAEALVGEIPATPLYDHPYPNGLYSPLNYTAWRSLGAYLIYRFRGVDTSFAGRADDLMWRWSRDPDQSFRGLANQLLGANCAECSLATRFAGLTTAQRFGRLIQDWRVANYVNNPSLDAGQYGFPSHLGFDPIRDVGNWKDNDLIASNNAISIPPEATVTTEWLLPRWYTSRPAGPGFEARPLEMHFTGAEYFVLRADPGLPTNHELVLRAQSDTLARVRKVTGSCNPVGTEAVLWMSAILYGQDDDSLFAHPEHATTVLNSRVVLDSLRLGAEIVVPSFGSTTKAVVVVVSAADQGEMEFVTGDSGPVSIAIYAQLRPAEHSEPLRLVATAGQHDDAPAWSPDGTEIAFSSRIPPTASYRQIFRVAAAGGTPQAVAPTARDQRNPDWSPRGDRIVFEQDSEELIQSDLYVRQLGTGVTEPLVSGLGSSTLPAFQPDGQMVAYVFDPVGATWEIRKVRVDGTGDSLVVALASPPQSLRWSPDGLWLWYSVRDTFNVEDSIQIDMLYQVSRNGGAPIRRKDLARPGRGIRSVEFHPSGSIAVLEETGQHTWPLICFWAGCGCEYPSVVDVPVYNQRLLLYDPAAANRTAPFHDLPTCKQHFPRLGPDGLRLAYSQNDSAASSMDRDLIVRRIAEHAPPVLVAPPNDTTFEAGPGTYVLDLDATDPEGLAVSFQGVQLPAGATFNPTTGVFAWPHPPGNTTVYPVFRALDAAGGVVTRIPKLSVLPGVAPDAVGDYVADLTTPTAIGLAWTAPGDDGGVGTAAEYDVRWSLAPLTAGNWSGAYAVEGEPAPAASGTWQSCWVQNLQPNTWYYIGIRARDEAFNWGPISVAYAKTVGSGGGGGAWAGPTDVRNEAPPDAAPGRGPVSYGASPPQPSAGATLVLEMETADGLPSLRLLRLPAGSGAGPGIIFQAAASDGAWRERCRFPDPGAGTIALCSRRAGAVRFLLTGDYAPDRLAATVTSAHGPALELTRVENSSTGELDPASGLESPDLALGDSLCAEYRAVASTGAKAEDWLVRLSRGTTSGDLRAEAPAAPSGPAAFALHPSRPNPFTGEVGLAFDLPRASRVRLEIHDLQGRLVAVFADREFAAGRHLATWDRRTRTGARAGPGVYLCTLSAGSFRAQRKMVALP